MRKISIVLLIFILTFSNLSFAGGYTFNISKSKNYSANDLYYAAIVLARENPDILELEIIGNSTDERAIYVLRMSEGDFKNSDKMHIMIDGGNHARETINPSVVLQTVNDYIINYRANGELSKMLDEFVFHFVTSFNPDGNDIVKFGPSIIKDKALKDYFAKNIKGDYKRLKANVKGVDLNRNFENYTLNQKTLNYASDASAPKKHALMNIIPSLEFYGGQMGSEIETQIAQDYYTRYDFRVYISYHSQGRVLYGDTTRFGLELDKLSKEYLKLAEKLTGYRHMDSSANVNPNPWGYAGRYVNGVTTKPFITVETTNGIPPTQSHFSNEYSKYKLYNLPLEYAKKAKEIGYFNFKLYQNGVYIRDVINKAHAQGLSKRFGYDYREYLGKPIIFIEDIPGK